MESNKKFLVAKIGCINPAGGEKLAAIGLPKRKLKTREKLNCVQGVPVVFAILNSRFDSRYFKNFVLELSERMVLNTTNRREFEGGRN